MSILWYILILVAISIFVSIAVCISKRLVRINAKKANASNGGKILGIMNTSPSVDEIEEVVKTVNEGMPISFDARGRIE